MNMMKAIRAGNGEKQKDITRRRISIGRNFFMYLFFLAFAIIFTQALRAPASNVLFWFMLLLPIGLLLYAATGLNAIRVYVTSKETTAVKNQIVSYEFRIINDSIIPYPFVDAQLTIPSEDGVKCVDKMVSLSLIPTGCYIFKNDMRFRYRGIYRVGVAYIYVQDFFRIFRLRLSVNIYNEIYILPRRIPLERETDNAHSDMPTDSNMIVRGNESSERSNIREYRGGDSLKHIHWKLSSKMQDIQVNEFMPNTGKNVYIFCDFAQLHSSEEPTAENGNNGKKEKVNGKQKKEKKKRHVKVKLKPASPREKSPEERIADAAFAAKAVYEAREALKQENKADETPAAPDTKNISDGTSDAAASNAVKNTDTNIDKDVVSSEDKNNGIRRNNGRFGLKNSKDVISYESYFAHANDIYPEYENDMDYFCADGVSEIAIGAAMREIAEGNNVTLMWFDSRVEGGYSSYLLRSYADIEAIFKFFATAPLAPYDCKVTRLPDLISDVQNPTFLFATAAVNMNNTDEFTNAANRMGAERTEILFFNPIERYKNSKLRHEYIEVCRSQLEWSNITLNEIRIK